MTKILVVHYSRTGFTKTVAGQIAKACGADLEAIRESGSRDGALGYLKSAWEAGLHLDIPIHNASHAPDAYDLVVIGSPIWFWNVASPVRAYIRKYRNQLHKVAFFCTCGSSGQSKVLADMQRLCGRPAVATFAATDAQISRQRHHSRLSKFASALKM